MPIASSAKRSRRVNGLPREEALGLLVERHVDELPVDRDRSFTRGECALVLLDDPPRPLELIGGRTEDLVQDRHLARMDARRAAQAHRSRLLSGAAESVEVV